MDSRQRILAAAERRRPDRPATSLRLTDEASASLQGHLGVGSTAEVFNALDTDLRWVDLPFIGPTERATPPLFGEGTDFWGCRFKRIDTGISVYFEFDYHPLAEAKTVDDVDNFDWPRLDWWDYDALPELVEQTNAGQRRAIMFFVGGAFETPWYLRGMERFLTDLCEQPDIAEAICRNVERYFRQRGLRVIDKIGDRIDLIGTGGDIGEQHRMLLSPAMWRRHIKPYSGNLIRTFKDLGYKTFYHTDGSVVPVIEDLIEVGLDILDPIQTSAAGMDPHYLYEHFGDRLTFHGAIDEQQLLPRADAPTVYSETTRMIDALGGRGGHIVSPTHRVQGDTSPENVVAIFEAAHNYRWS